MDTVLRLRKASKTLNLCITSKFSDKKNVCNASVVDRDADLSGPAGPGVGWGHTVWPHGCVDGDAHFKNFVVFESGS